MMRIKYILIICVFLLTGCATTYNIKINEDLTVLESVKIYGDDDIYDMYNKTTKTNVMRSLLEPYAEILKEKNYTYELKEESNPNIYIEKKYTDIKQLIDNSILFNDYFDEIKYEKNGNIVKVETIGFNPVGKDETDRFMLSSLDITISSKYRIVNSNAKQMDDYTNTMFFELEKDAKDFKIQFEIDISKKYNPWIKTYIVIGIMVVVIISLWLMSLYTKKKHT